MTELYTQGLLNGLLHITTVHLLSYGGRGVYKIQPVVASAHVTRQWPSHLIHFALDKLGFSP